MTFREADKMVRNDGWKPENIKGSHYHYKHDSKPGKVTIPFHNGDLPKRVINSIKRQADIK
jgi:predicted RNA binding protein YcfA (HicA-like mRNA interferase family)